MAKQADLTPQWEQDDQQALRDFLGKNPRFVLWLIHNRPTLQKSAPAADRQLYGLDIARHFEVIELIQQMASEERKAPDGADFINT